MRATASALGGLCILEEHGSEIVVINVSDSSRVPPDLVHFACSSVDDWQSIEGVDHEALLREVRLRNAGARALSNIEVCLHGVSSDLQKDLLCEVDDHLKACCSAMPLKAILLRAPLVSTETLRRLISTCLSEGFASVAKLLEDVREAQPLLCRLVDRWLSLSDHQFDGLDGGRQRLWRMAVDAGVILKTLSASTGQAVENEWAGLIFRLPSPRERVVVSRVARAVTEALFTGHADSHSEVHGTLDLLAEDHATEHAPHQIRQRNGHIQFERALKQVEAVVAAVAQGHDARARRFLRDLVAAQTSCPENEEHSVKSLCNIAKQCADLFRTDFEFECLQTAVGILPNDPWMLVQVADYYKRTGQFERAVSKLHEADMLGDKTVVQSSLADVYVQMGNFAKASEIYDAIPDGKNMTTIRSAKADLFRRWGRFDDARREYDCLISDGLATHRVFAGQAEIAKREGNLELARSLYDRLLKEGEMDDSSRVIYRMALARVLIRLDELSAAFKTLDDVVQKRPFLREARALRAAVAGLHGMAAEAIKDLPQLGQAHAFNEWVNDYVRGLLLLLLDRHGAARVSLLRNVEDRLLDEDAKGLLELGAVVYFLRSRGGMKDAAIRLKRIPDIQDAFARNVRMAFEYHVAVELQQEADIERILGMLRAVDDHEIKTLVLAIGQRDWKRVFQLEARALLRLAA
jgi:tetratricopeptide (TPR) repeat protein